jgi:ABC-2 type transport system permease protein
VGGKFLSTLILIIIVLVLTLPYYITVSSLGPIDHGAVLTGYLGLILISGAYIAIGLFTSSISNNQIVAYLLALLIGIFFQIIFGLLSDSLSGIPADIVNYLSMSDHFDSISRGVIDTRDLLFFLSVMFTGLILTEYNLVRKRYA